MGTGQRIPPEETGGGIQLLGGVPGVDGGAGGGFPGPVNIGTQYTSNVTIGEDNPLFAGVNIKSGSASIHIGQTATARTITLGGAIGAAQTIEIGAGTSANIITVGSTSGAASLTLRSGTGGLSLTSTSVGLTAVNISATAGTTNIEARDNAAVAVRIKEGGNNYLTVTTTNGSESVSVDQFLNLASSNGGGLLLTSGEALTANDVVTLDTNAGAGGGRVIQSNNASAGPPERRTVVGVVQTNAGGAGTTVKVATVHGSLVVVSFDVAPANTDQGKPVFLDNSGGQVSLTPPVASGAYEIMVGILQDAATSKIIFMPKFIREVP